MIIWKIDENWDSIYDSVNYMLGSSLIIEDDLSDYHYNP